MSGTLTGAYQRDAPPPVTDRRGRPLAPESGTTVAQANDKHRNLAGRRIVEVLGGPKPKGDGTVLLRVLTEEIEA
jgi:hypothetical protein